MRPHDGDVLGAVCEILGNAAGKFIVDEENVDVVFLDAASDLLRRGADVEQEDRTAGVALRRQRHDEVAAVARHNADAQVLEPGVLLIFQ